ncbi:MAG: haloacid dehalogenase-like hydrolase [Rickettsiales bacterium]|jgi:phosphoserine phosphatase|nr:haloacid dehalogenase-like hydrolase [Rickettsiales bacterium]
MKIVLFDFDGTLSARDANAEFYKYTFFRSFRQFLFLPWLIAGAVGKLLNPNGKWCREAMRRYLTPGMARKYAAGFIKEHRRNRFGWAAEKIAEEKARGATVVCISASPDFLLPPLVADLGFDAVISSVMDKAKPWRYDKPCWGEWKVDRLDEWANGTIIMNHTMDPGLPPSPFGLRRTSRAPLHRRGTLEVVRAYSDSKSDLPMMRLAKEQVWVDSRTGMRKK